MGIITNRDRALRRQSPSKIRSRTPRKDSMREGELTMSESGSGLIFLVKHKGRIYRSAPFIPLDKFTSSNAAGEYLGLEVLSNDWAEAKYEMVRNLQRIVKQLGFKDSLSLKKAAQAGGGAAHGGGGGGGGPTG